MKKLLQSIALIATLSAALSLSAQTDVAQVTGNVTDATGAAISGATIVAHSVVNGNERKATSGSSGSYALHDVPTGPYSITVTAPGFGKYTSSFVASVGGSTTVDVKLAVNEHTDTIEVSAADVGADVNDTNAEISQVITPLQMTQLPSVNRDPYSFVFLSGNVSNDPNGSTARGVGVSFSGERAASTEILLDGVENVLLFSQGVGVNVPLDSVQEYRVVTSGFDAQYGRASGGVVNLITKSGTNQYHGTLYEFNRISALAAHTYFEDASAASGSPLPADHFTQNQFGYSIGGPVLPRLRDKLFFFSNTEWNRVRSSGSAQFVVPTPAFIAAAAANTKAYFAQYGQLAPGVIVNKTPAGLAAGLEEVTVTAPINSGAGAPINAWFTSDRIDYRVSDKTDMFFRYGSYKDNISPGTNSLSPYAGFDTGTTDYDQTSVASIDHFFTPNLIATVKFQFSRVNGGQPLGPAGIVPGMYLYSSNSASTDAATGLPIVLPGYLPESPGDAIPFAGPQNLYQFQGDTSWVRKAHTFHVGGGFIQVRDNHTFGAYETAVESVGSPSGGETAGLAALKAGTLYSYQAAINPGGKYPCVTNGGVATVTAACSITLPVGPPSFTHENTFNDGDWYISDSWKYNSRLTLTLGVRWEYYGVQHDTKPYLDTNFYDGAGSNPYQQIRNGIVEPATQSPVHGLYAKSLYNYAPRVGFAYDLTGDGKTSVRGGYGISYERNFGNVTFNSLFNPPNYGVVDLTSGQNSPQLTISTNNYGPLAGAAGTSQPLPPVELRAMDPHLRTAYAYSYNLSLEREVLRNTLVQLSYNGTRGLHQYSIANINKAYSGAVYLGDSVASGNPLNLQYGSINVREANADSYYNSGNLRVIDNNYSRYGLQFTFNYTMSHALDNLSSTFSESGANFNLGYTDPFIPGLDRGNSDYDVRNRIAFGGVYEPKFAYINKSGLMKTLLGGFELAPVLSWRNGTPISIFDCQNALYSCDRILDAPGLKFKGNTSVATGYDQYNYITVPNAAVNNYADPIVGVDDFPTFSSKGEYQTVGMGKDQFATPNNWDLDMGVYKTFYIKERYKLQLRSEFYNLPNHHNFYANGYDGYVLGNGPGGIAGYINSLKGTPNGYSPSSSDERRFVQLAAKIEF